MDPREFRALRGGGWLLRAAIQNLGLSARSYDRLLIVARTVADLEGGDRILAAHVAEAIRSLSLGRKLAG